MQQSNMDEGQNTVIGNLEFIGANVVCAAQRNVSAVDITKCLLSIRVGRLFM